MHNSVDGKLPSTTSELPQPQLLSNERSEESHHISHSKEHAVHLLAPRDQGSESNISHGSPSFSDRHLLHLPALTRGGSPTHAKRPSSSSFTTQRVEIPLDELDQDEARANPIPPRRNSKMSVHNLLTPDAPSPMTVFPDIRTRTSARVPDAILESKPGSPMNPDNGFEKPFLPPPTTPAASSLVSIRNEGPSTQRIARQNSEYRKPIEPKAKRPWTEQEDTQLRQLVSQFGQGLWAAIAAQIPGRSGKQVRERWLNHLSPNVTKRPWSSEEDEIILESHQRFGNSWSRIAKLLEGRSDNSVKNRFYTTLRRRITPRGVGKRVVGRVRGRVWE